jgi:hypothetical protein
MRDGESTMNRKLLGLILALSLLSVVYAGCSKGSAGSKPMNAEQVKAQAELEKKTPHLAQTVRGNVERMGLAVQAANDAYKQTKWADVTAQLNTTLKEVNAALADTPEKKKTTTIRSLFDEIKGYTENALKSAEGRDKATEWQLTQLQTAVNALKVQMGN